MTLTMKLNSRVEFLGRAAGRAAGEWAIAPERLPRAEMLRILQGIVDGDPAVMDAYVPPNLSGTYAGEWTPEKLAEILEISEEDVEFDVYCDTWETAAQTAFWGEIERILLYHTKKSQ